MLISEAVKISKKVHRKAAAREVWVELNPTTANRRARIKAFGSDKQLGKHI